MTERPILFSAPMIKAILEGRKTQTRRIIKPLSGDYKLRKGDHLVSWPADAFIRQGAAFRPRFAPGDMLWVREAFTLTQHNVAVYRADGVDQTGMRWPSITPGDPESEVKWKPSIYMPRWASRITLKVMAVKVERLQDITEEDAKAEGVARIGRKYIERNIGADLFSKGPNFWTVEGLDIAGNWPTARECFASLWYHVNGDPKELWDDTPFNAACWRDNPWVAAISFERVM